MERPVPATLRIGAWRLDPASGQITREGKDGQDGKDAEAAETIRLEVRTMRLLLCLAERAGEVVSIDELLTHVWSGVTVSQDSVYQAIASLRRQLGDDPKQPAYIETVPRLGYRMIATVSRPDSDSSAISPADKPSIEQATSSNHVPPHHPQPPIQRVIFRITWAAAAALCLALAFLLFHGKAASSNHPATSSQQPQKSIAVLPFLDLTEGMHQGEFADGMTEELIDKLSKIPGLRVPSPTSSFYFKDKQLPLAEIAKSLGVAYVLDGSVRKSGSMLRVAARLVRADNGYIIWSETYDRPFDDILMVQDNIATEVTKALKTSIGATSEHGK
jgi:transcriptional activator of cad operon